MGSDGLFLYTVVQKKKVLSDEYIYYIYTFQQQTTEIQRNEKEAEK